MAAVDPWRDPATTRLLALVDDAAGLDADVGDPALQRELERVVDALAHALVDLADGAPFATVAARGEGARDESARSRPAAPLRLRGLDVVSCSALAGRLRQLADRVAREPARGPGSAGRPPLVTTVAAAAGATAVALQGYAQELAPQRHGGAADRAVQARAEARLATSLRHAQRLLAPPGPPEKPEKPAHPTVMP